MPAWAYHHARYTPDRLERLQNAWDISRERMVKVFFAGASANGKARKIMIEKIRAHGGPIEKMTLENGTSDVENKNEKMHVRSQHFLLSRMVGVIT